LQKLHQEVERTAMSKEVKPLEWYIRFKPTMTFMGCNVEHGVRPEINEPGIWSEQLGEEKLAMNGFIHVIEYTPEVKRAVECFEDLVRALKDYTILQQAHGITPRFTAELLERTKGQA
jgi:hypothetical protein